MRLFELLEALLLKLDEEPEGEMVVGLEAEPEPATPDEDLLLFALEVSLVASLLAAAAIAAKFNGVVMRVLLGRANPLAGATSGCFVVETEADLFPFVAVALAVVVVGVVVGFVAVLFVAAVVVFTVGVDVVVGLA